MRFRDTLKIGRVFVCRKPGNVSNLTEEPSFRLASVRRKRMLKSWLPHLEDNREMVNLKFAMPSFTRVGLAVEQYSTPSNVVKRAGSASESRGRPDVAKRKSATSTMSSQTPLRTISPFASLTTTSIVNFLLQDALPPTTTNMVCSSMPAASSCSAVVDTSRSCRASLLRPRMRGVPEAMTSFSSSAEDEGWLTSPHVHSKSLEPAHPFSVSFLLSASFTAPNSVLAVVSTTDPSTVRLRAELLSCKRIRIHLPTGNTQLVFLELPPSVASRKRCFESKDRTVVVLSPPDWSSKSFPWYDSDAKSQKLHVANSVSVPSSIGAATCDARA
mmetsp:Transcript_1260/g.4470  ORF Transcript_1260/g.4470 Transcript_1260/m.4470 type:complete len:329 (+) Transcript_1260:1707-2693(+)